MKLHTFNFMPLEVKAAIAMRAGTWLVSRYQGRYYVELYYMDTFFSEVWQELKSDEVVLAVGFTGTNLLTPYLELIDLPPF